MHFSNVFLNIKITIQDDWNKKIDDSDNNEAQKPWHTQEIFESLVLQIQNLKWKWKSYRPESIYDYFVRVSIKLLINSVLSSQPLQNDILEKPTTFWLSNFYSISFKIKIVHKHALYLYLLKKRRKSKWIHMNFT